MSAFNHHRVHFQTSPKQQSTTTTTPQPWSERHKKLSKLLDALTNSNHLNLNQHLINSSIHLNLIHHQSDLETHQLNFKTGLLIELSNKLLEQNSNHHHHPSSSSTTEIKLLKRVIKSQLDPNLDFIKIRELSSSESGKVSL